MGLLLRSYNIIIIIITLRIGFFEINESFDCSRPTVKNKIIRRATDLGSDYTVSLMMRLYLKQSKSAV